MSTERQLTDKFKEAFETKNLEILRPYLAESMTYELLPSTVGGKQGKNDWITQLNGMFAIIESAKLDVTNIVEHPKFIVAQAIANLNFTTGPFSQEILLIFNFKEEGGALKIASIIEYVDSFKVKEWKAKMASLRAQSS